MWFKIKKFCGDFVKLMAEAQALEINAYQVNSKSQLRK